MNHIPNSSCSVLKFESNVINTGATVTYILKGHAQAGRTIAFLLWSHFHRNCNENMAFYVFNIFQNPPRRAGPLKSNGVSEDLIKFGLILKWKQWAPRRRHARHVQELNKEWGGFFFCAEAVSRLVGNKTLSRRNNNPAQCILTENYTVCMSRHTLPDKRQTHAW